MRNDIGELIWTLFWIVLAVLGIVFSWYWWVIVICFALAGIIWFDGDMLNF